MIKQLILRIVNKKILLLALFIPVLFIAKAQDYVRTKPETPQPEDKKFFLSISIGPAIPFQDFGSTHVKNSFWDFNSPDSVRLQGFAKTGFHFDLAASYLISDNFGIMVLLGGNSNSFDATTFSSTIGLSAYTPSGNYYTGEYLIGPYLSFPLGPKLALKLHALIGLVTSSYPELYIALNDTTTLDATFSPGKNLGYSFGAGIDYSVNNNINILFNAGYTTSKLTYPGWSATYSIVGYYPVTVSHSNDVTEMSTGILKLNIGIEFKF